MDLSFFFYILVGKQFSGAIDGEVILCRLGVVLEARGYAQGKGKIALLAMGALSSGWALESAVSYFVLFLANAVCCS